MTTLDQRLHDQIVKPYLESSHKNRYGLSRLLYSGKMYLAEKTLRWLLSYLGTEDIRSVLTVSGVKERGLSGVLTATVFIARHMLDDLSTDEKKVLDTVEEFCRGCPDCGADVKQDLGN